MRQAIRDRSTSGLSADWGSAGGIRIGNGLLGTGVTGLLKRIEAWASQSEERSRMLIILIFVAFGLLVAAFILVLALVMLDLG